MRLLTKLFFFVVEEKQKKRSGRNAANKAYKPTLIDPWCVFSSAILEAAM